MEEGGCEDRRQDPTSDLPTFEKTQQTFSQMKKFCNSHVSVVTFLDRVGKWITACFPSEIT